MGGTPPASAVRIPVVRAADLRPGQTAKFAWEARGRTRRGFVLNYRGTVRAFVNECAHIATGLDCLENEFFDKEGRYLVCAMHGALYEPDTGDCVSGPPCGASLDPLRVEVEGEEVVVYVEVADDRPWGST